MSRPHALPLVLILFLLTATAACGGEAKVAQTPAGSAAGSPASASASAGDGATAAANAVEIRVAITDGKVAPGPSVHKIRRGQTVRLIVTSDKADELHVHGYDKTGELSAGTPATVEFRADQTGRFEVETHESDLQLLQLEVS